MNDCAEGGRHRRDLDPSGAHLSDSGGDMERRRPFWFGGADRLETSMDEFHQWLNSTTSNRIRLAVMDRWKLVRASTLEAEYAPHAAMLFDTFHVLRHLGVALDTVRKTEYPRLTGKGRRFIKGQKYTLHPGFKYVGTSNLFEQN